MLRCSVFFFLVLLNASIYTKILFSFSKWKIGFRITEPSCDLMRRDLFCYFMVYNAPIYWKKHSWTWKFLILAWELQELFEECKCFSCQKSVCWINSVNFYVVAMISFCYRQDKNHTFLIQAIWNSFTILSIQILKC